MTNTALHNDLKLPTANELTKNHCKKCHPKLTNHSDRLINNMSSLTSPQNIFCRFYKRYWSGDISHKNLG